MKKWAALILAGSVFSPFPAPAATDDDEVDFESMVEIVKAEAVKAGKSWEIEVTFNLLPDMPKGIRVSFTLMRDDVQQPLETFAFTLADEIRKNVKVKFQPRERLFIGDHVFKTDILVQDQTKDIQKAIEGNKRRFPPDRGSWSITHSNAKFPVGTEADEKAEFEEMKKFTMERVDKLVILNNEVLDEIDAAMEGKGFAKGGRLDVAAFRKYLEEWGKKLAEEQRIGREAAGLYGSKHPEIHAYLLELGRMVGKRIWRGTEFEELLGKHGLDFKKDLNLPAVRGIDSNYRWKVTGKALDTRVKRIEMLLNPEPIPPPGEEGAEAGATEEGAGKAPEPEEDPADDDAGKGDPESKSGPKKEGKPAAQPPSKKGGAAKKKPAKKAKK